MYSKKDPFHPCRSTSNSSVVFVAEPPPRGSTPFDCVVKAACVDDAIVFKHGIKDWSPVHEGALQGIGSSIIHPDRLHHTVAEGLDCLAPGGSCVEALLGSRYPPRPMRRPTGGQSPLKTSSWLSHQSVGCLALSLVTYPSALIKVTSHSAASVAVEGKRLAAVFHHAVGNHFTR